MSMTSLIKKKGRLLHMEFMISQKTKDGLVLELVLIPLNLLWQVFEAGGSKWEKNPIQMLLNFISMLMEEEAMDREQVYGKLSYRNWQMNFKWKFMFHTFLQEQANGIRLNTECLALFLKIGEEDLSLIVRQWST